MSVCEPAPVPATVTSVCRAWSSVLTGDLNQVVQKPTSRSSEPMATKSLMA